MYFKYYHSQLFKCILNAIGHVIVFYIFAKVKYFFKIHLKLLCSMVRKKCYQIDFFTVLISATLGTHWYLVSCPVLLME